MNNLHADDLSRAADKLMKDKIEKVTPVPLPAVEKQCIDSLHVVSLPTLGEIYAIIAKQLLKYALGIGLAIAGICILNSVLDEISMILGY